MCEYVRFVSIAGRFAEDSAFKVTMTHSWATVMLESELIFFAAHTGQVDLHCVRLAHAVI